MNSLYGKWVAIVSMAAFVSGCVYYPTKTEHYVAECDITTGRMELDVTVVDDSCSGSVASVEEAASCLALMIAVSAVTAVVSGSVVIIGNTAFWLDQEVRCFAKSSS